jgi:hypothetical protein
MLVNLDSENPCAHPVMWRFIFGGHEGCRACGGIVK